MVVSFRIIPELMVPCDLITFRAWHLDLALACSGFLQALHSLISFVMVFPPYFLQELEGRAITCNNARQMVERPEGEEGYGDEAPKKAPGNAYAKILFLRAYEHVLLF